MNKYQLIGIWWKRYPPSPSRPADSAGSGLRKDSAPRISFCRRCLFRFAELHQVIVVLTAIFVLALILRLWFIDYGLPNLYFEDEAFFTGPALRALASPWGDPGWFNTPAHTLIYVLAAIFRLVNWSLNFQHGVVVSVRDNYRDFITPFQIWGRVFPAVIGAATTVGVYLVAKRWNQRTGLIAAALVGTSVLLVWHSHIIRPDILQAFFLVGLVWFLFRIIEKPTALGNFIGAGICWGLAIDSKYPALFLIVPVLAVLIYLQRKKLIKWTKWLWLAAATVAASFIAAPFVYLKYQESFTGLMREFFGSHPGNNSLGFGGNLWWYATTVLNWEIGTLLYLVALGVVVVLVIWFYHRKINRRGGLMLLLALTGFSYLALLALLDFRWERWTIPALPFLLILSAVGLDWLWRRRWPLLLIIALTVVIMAGPALRLARLLYGLSHPNTADVMSAWISANLPDKTKFLIEPYGPPLPSDRYRVMLVPNVTWYELDRFRREYIHYFVITGGVHGRIEQEIGIGTSDSGYLKAWGDYQSLLEKSDLIHEVDVNEKYSGQQLLYGDDFTIWQTPRLDMLLGSEQKLYRLKD